MSIKFFPDSKNICFEKPSGKTLCIPNPDFRTFSLDFTWFSQHFPLWSPSSMGSAAGWTCRPSHRSRRFATDLGILGRPVELLVCALPEVWSHLLVRPTETYGRLKLFETSYEMSFKEVETPERHRRNSRAKGIYMSIHMQDSMFSARWKQPNDIFRLRQCWLELSFCQPGHSEMVVARQVAIDPNQKSQFGMRRQEPDGQLSEDKVDVLYQTNYLLGCPAAFDGHSRLSWTWLDGLI